VAETIPDLRYTARPVAYAELRDHLHAILEGERDEIAAMATLSALVHHAFGHLWTGFYRVSVPGKLLRVGPYQGSLGCLEIAFGRGVCGTAAAERRTVIVPDVALFPGHITCDANARSEIVVPVFNARDDLIAVFDVDSAQLNSFDEQDQAGLESLVSLFASDRS